MSSVEMMIPLSTEVGPPSVGGVSAMAVGAPFGATSTHRICPSAKVSSTRFSKPSVST